MINIINNLVPAKHIPPTYLLFINSNIYIYTVILKSTMFIYSTFQTSWLSLQTEDQIVYSKYTTTVSEFQSTPKYITIVAELQNMPLKTSSVGVAVVLHHGCYRNFCPGRRYALDCLLLTLDGRCKHCLATSVQGILTLSLFKTFTPGTVETS